MYGGVAQKVWPPHGATLPQFLGLSCKSEKVQVYYLSKCLHVFEQHNIFEIAC